MKENKKKLKLIGVISVIIVIVILLLPQSKNNDQQEKTRLAYQHPTLQEESEPSVLTGFIAKHDEFHGMMQTTELDKKAFEINKKMPLTTKIQRGVNFIYSDTDISYKDVLRKIDPQPQIDGNYLKAIVLTFDTENQRWNEWPDAFYIGRNPNENEIIKANAGIVLISTIDTLAFDLKSRKDIPQNNINSVCDIPEGWNLIANSLHMIDKIDCAERINYIWTQTSEQKTAKRDENGKILKEAEEAFELTFENKNNTKDNLKTQSIDHDIEQEKINSGTIHWFNIGPKI